MNSPKSIALAALLALAACAPTYTLVAPATTGVAKSAMKVTPGMSWNRIPKGPFDVAWEENWTENGPLLDSVGFIAGLPDGQAIARQRRKEDRKVPVFRASMTPQDLVSMIESYYRIKAGATVFETAGVEPTSLLGKPALRFDYGYVGMDEVRRRGRSVAAIVDGKLYLMTLDGAALHYSTRRCPTSRRWSRPPRSADARAAAAWRGDPGSPVRTRSSGRRTARRPTPRRGW